MAMGISVILCAVFYMLPPSPSAQIFILLVFGGLIGLPHGLTDWKILKNIPKSFGINIGPLSNKLLGGIIYAVSALLFFVCWSIMPMAVFVIFIALSVFHFGTQDIAAHNIQGRFNVIHVVIRGSAPIILPYLFHPETAYYFNLLLSDYYFLPIAISQNIMIGLASIAFYTFSALLTRHVSYLLETLLLITLFVTLPPLLSFTIYFCVWHTPRHYIDVIQWYKPFSYTRALQKELKLWLCGIFVMIMLAAFCLIGFLFVSDMLKFSENHSIWFFQILSALTFSHVLYNSTARKQ